MQHINCKNSSRLPVLVVAAAYASVKDLIGEQAKELLSHQAADRQTGALGDVEITLLTEENTITCYEMKSKAVLKTDIEKSIEKMGKHGSRIDNYIFITTDFSAVHNKDSVIINSNISFPRITTAINGKTIQCK